MNNAFTNLHSELTKCSTILAGLLDIQGTASQDFKCCFSLTSFSPEPKFLVGDFTKWHLVKCHVRNGNVLIAILEDAHKRDRDTQFDLA